MLYDKNSAILVTVYLILGFFWIYTSDIWVLKLTSNPEAITSLQTSKGWFYVAGSGILLYFLSSFLNGKVDNTSRDYLRVFYDHPTPMVVRDKNTLIISDCNLSAKKIFNRELNVEKQTLEEIIEPLDSAIADLYPDFEKHQSTSSLAKLTMQDGAEKYLEIHPQDFIRQASAVELVVIFDVTSVIRLLMENHKLIKNLKEYAETTSHDIRKPLSNILGLSELLDSDTLAPDELKKTLDFLRQSALELDNELKKVADGKFG